MSSNVALCLCHWHVVSYLLFSFAMLNQTFSRILLTLNFVSLPDQHKNWHNSIINAWYLLYSRLLHSLSVLVNSLLPQSVQRPRSLTKMLPPFGGLRTGRIIIFACFVVFGTHHVLPLLLPKRLLSLFCSKKRDTAKNYSSLGHWKLNHSHWCLKPTQTHSETIRLKLFAMPTAKALSIPLPLQFALTFVWLKGSTKQLHRPDHGQGNCKL